MRPMFFHGDSFISHKYKFIYFCIPKVASQTILDYLERLDPQGKRAKNLQPNSIPMAAFQAPDWARFAFVRNPYARILSFYFDKIVNYDGSEGKQALMGRYQSLKPFMKIDEFFAWLESAEGVDLFADAHFLSQHYFLFSSSGQVTVSFVGRMEQFNNDMQKLQDRLGLPHEQLGELNTNHGKERKEQVNTRENWRAHLTCERIRVIEARYHSDFALLNYPRLSADGSE
jgi:hypothetical protein